MAVSEDQNQETSHPVNESELEQYGVWVKAGPEDVIEAEAEDEGFSLDDLSEDSLDEIAIATPDSSAEESPVEDLSEDLSEDLAEISLDDTAEGISLDEEEDSLEELSLEDITDEVPSEDELDILELDDTIQDEPVTTTAEDEGLLTLEEEDLTIDMGDESEELGVDVSDELAVEPDALPAEPVDDLDELGDELTLEDDLEELDEPVDLSETADTVPPAASGGSGDGILDDNLSIEEDLPDDLNDLTLDLDELDVDSFEETGEGADLQTPDEVEELDLSTLPDSDDSFGDISADELTQDEDADVPELPVDELDTADELDALDLGEPDSEPIDELPAEDDLAIEEDILSLDELEIDEETPARIDEEIDLDLDLGSVDEGVPAEAVVPAGGSGDDRSVSLLESIERELSSIRSELGDLKRELGELRTAAPATAPAEAPVDEDEAGGFFAETEDDDETIALTGAELDNIMNTAEFTEETGQPTEIDDLLAGGDAAPVSEISLEEPAPEAEPLDIDLETSEAEIVDVEAEEPDALAGSNEEVDALASMDIDAELADIDELEDTSDAMPDVSAGDLPDLGIELEDETIPEDEPVFDAEPIDIDLPEPDLVAESDADLPDNLKSELKDVLSYMDQLLENLPEDKIQEFARSDHFAVYQKLFKELGLES
jgi:pilus assembly protein FimV